MSEATPPEWVRKRDGRVVPFEADKISRSLFAVTEALTRPDAFLARELADSVVHFLAAETEGKTPSTEEVAETVAKVVRELGHPALAEAFVAYRQLRSTLHAPRSTQLQESEIVVRFAADAPLAVVLNGCARQFTLQTVFARDLVAAQADGLLTLTGLERPDELAGCVLGGLVTPAGSDAGLVEALEQARRLAGEFVVLDGPEHLLARQDNVDVTTFARALDVGLRLTGLRAVVNLNTALPPAAVDDLAGAPLFVGQRQTPAPERLAELADALADVLLGKASVRVDWHLSEADFTAAGRTRLEALARRALAREVLGFVFDKPRRSVALAEGLDRLHPESLLAVGLHLPRLAAQPGMDGDAERFVTKLASLARLAASAGRQRRAYLRRQRPGGAAVAEGFLPDRARLMVVPVGLEAVVRTLTGKGLSGGGTAAELGKRIVQRLREVLHADRRAVQTEACIDGPFSHAMTGGPIGTAEQVAGLTGWDPALTAKAQGRAAGPLHALAEGGTLALFLPTGTSPADVAGCLEMLWRQTDVMRVRLAQSNPEQRALAFPGAGGQQPHGADRSPDDL